MTRTPPPALRRWLPGRWLPAALWAAVVLIATSWPNPGAPAVQGGDKVAHLVLYAGLAWFTARAAAPGRRLPVLWTVAAVAAFGAADEWHQQFIPGRSTSAADWTADAAGGVLGALAASVAARRAAARRA